MAANTAISITLNLDAGNFTAGIASASGAVTTFNTQINNLVNNVDSAGGAVSKSHEGFVGLTIAITAAHEALKLLRDAFMELPQSLAEAGGEFQRLQTMMEGFSQASTRAGKLQDANQMTAWIYDLSKNAPFALQTLQDSFVKLKAVGIDPTNGSLKAVTDAVAAFGGSDAKLQEATLAIQEMAGRGTISLEQLRRQLGKAIPDAIGEMASSMDLTYGQLMEKVQAGTLGSTVVLQKFLEQLERTYDGQGVAHMQNFIGLSERLSTTWVQMEQTIDGFGQNGVAGAGTFMDELTKQMNDLIGVLSSPVGKQFGAEFGQVLAEMVRDLRYVIDEAMEFDGVIRRVGEALLIAFAANRGITMLQGAFTGLLGTATQLSRGITAMGSAYTKTFTSAYTSTMQLGYSLNQFQSVSRAAAMTAGVLSGSLRALSIGMLEIVPVVGQIVLVLYTLAQAFDMTGDKARDAAEDITNGFITAQKVADVKQKVDEINKQLEQLGKAKGQSAYDPLSGTTINYDDMIADLTKQRDKYVTALEAGNKEIGDRDTQSYIAAIQKSLTEKNAATEQAFNDQEKVINELRSKEKPAAGSARAKELSQMRMQNDEIEQKSRLANLESFVEQQQALLTSADAMQRQEAQAALNVLEPMLTDAHKAMDKSFNIDMLQPETVEKTKKGLSSIDEAILHLKEGIDGFKANMSGLNIEQILGSADGGKFKSAAADDVIAMEQIAAAAAKTNDGGKQLAQTLETVAGGKFKNASAQDIQAFEQIAKAIQSAQGKGVEYAKVLDAISAGKYKDSSAAQIALLKQLAQQWDQTKAANEDYNRTQQKSTQAWTDLQSKAEEASTKLKELTAVEQQGDKEPAAVRELAASLEVLRQKIDPAKYSLTEYDATVQKILEDSRAVASLDMGQKLEDEAKKIRESLSDVKSDNYEKFYNDEYARMEKLLEEFKGTEEQKQILAKETTDYIAALRQKTDKEEENALQQIATQWGNAYKQIGDTVKTAMNSMVDAFAKWAATGKLDMASLLQTVEEDFLKMELEEQLSPLMKDAGDALKGLFGGGSSAASSASSAGGAASSAGGAAALQAGATTLQTGATTLQTGATTIQTGAATLQTGATTFSTTGTLFQTSTTQFQAAITQFDAAIAQLQAAAASMSSSGSASGLGSLAGAAATSSSDDAAVAFFHSGGIVGGTPPSMGSVSSSLFFGAPRFHSGGIIGDEVPIIAKAGEGVFTSAQMKAMGGGGGAAPTVQVNVINQTSQQVNAQQQGNTRWDGRQMVLDIVLSAVTQPGNFRDNMRAAVK